MNTSDFVDEDSAASNWIELRNRGNTDVLLMDGILPTTPLNLGSGAFLQCLRQGLPGRLCIQ